MPRPFRPVVQYDRQMRARRSRPAKLATAKYWCIALTLAAYAIEIASAAGNTSGPSFPYFNEIQNKAANQQAHLLLVASVIDGKESEKTVTLRRATGDADYGVSLETLGAALDVVISPHVDGSFGIDTPLGHADFTAEDVTADRGGSFVPLPVAAKKLGCRLRFNEAEFALVVDTSWRDLRGAPIAKSAAVTIDVPAPNVSLSRWRSEVTSQRSGGDISTSTVTDLGGALGKGYWQGQILNGIGARARINELVWVVDNGPARWLIGQQRVAINPLLPGFDLTGAQMAYTNSPDYLYSQSPLNGQLVPYAASPLTVIRGQGPPGGVAELRLGGQVLMRQTIGLDGQYQFRNVPASPGDAIRLEVAIYEFRDVDVPTRVDRVYSQASNLQLPEGTWVSFGGAGLNGRRLDSSDDASGGAGFYQFRYGISSALTVDAVVESVNGQRYASAGAAASLGVLGTWAAYGARNSSGSSAYEVLGDGRRNDWFWHVNVQHLDAGFAASEAVNTETATRTTDASYAEFGRSFGTTARLSVVHGSVTDPVSGNIDYTKLAADWHPLPSLTLSARPDYRGDYSYAASWYPTKQTHVSLTRYIDRTEAAAEYDINSDYRLMATDLHQDKLGSRAGVFLARQAFGNHHASWTIGALSGEGTTGYFVEGGLEIRPGLTARLDVLKDPLLRNGGASGPIVTLDVVADFAVTGSGLARGGYDMALRQIGGISGALLGQLPRGVGGDSLAHVGVSLNGQIRAETDEAGHFFIDGLKPGVYRVSLDPDNLPIELSGSEHARNVEVRSGATTRADFHLELSLGCAGRVVGYGDTQLLQVAVLDGAGQVVKRVAISQYGFFRADGLKPGNYHLELRNAATGAAIATLPLSITDRFVFGRDFRADLAGKSRDQP
jgi:hypothetical protein